MRNLACVLLCFALLTAMPSWAAPAASPSPSASPAHAQPPAPAAQEGQQDGLLALAQRLDLNEQQVGQIKIVLLGVRTTAQTAGMKYNAEAKLLQEAMEKSASIEEIRGHMQSMAECNIDVDIANIEAARAVEKILTPEQLKKFKDMQQSQAGQGQAPAHK